MDDDRIITHAMIRAQDQERIAALTGLLLEAVDALKSWYDDSGFPYPKEFFDRIEAALKGE